MTTPSAALQTITVNNVNPGTLLVGAGDGPTLIGNIDLTTTLWLSRNVSVIAARPQDAIALPPQSTLVVDGTDNVYGITAGPTITVTLVPGGTGFFQNTNLPASVGSVPAFNANTSWGPFTFNMAGAAAYTIALTPNVMANSAATDITVQHLDASGNLILQEFFGAIPCGTWIPAGTSAVTLVRGNLYGTSIRISGQSASQAFVNALSPLAETVTGLSINVSSLPHELAAGAQKLVPSYAGAQNLVQGQLWYSGPLGINCPGGSTLNQGFLGITEGPVITTFRYTGSLTAVTNARLIFSFYSVAAGSAQPVSIMRPMNTLAGLETFTLMNFPGALCRIDYANTDASTAAIFFANVISSNQV